jgi:hypothetical protein
MTQDTETETQIKTYRMIVTTEDDKGRTHSEQIRHIPEGQVTGYREATRSRMPRGSVYTVKVIAEI